MDVEPFPFATVDDLKIRWQGFPLGGEAHAEVLLDDASQYMLDVAPSAADASENTRKRIVCAVVRRVMQSDTSDMDGLESVQHGAGPFQETLKPVNPHGDFYLTGQEKRALGFRRQRAFSIDLLAGVEDVG